VVARPPAQERLRKASPGKWKILLPRCKNGIKGKTGQQKTIKRRPQKQTDPGLRNEHGPLGKKNRARKNRMKWPTRRPAETDHGGRV